MQTHWQIQQQPLQYIRGTGFLTDDLTIQKDGRQRKYLGVCKLLKPGAKHRRLDIIVVPFEERACAVMYFTGSAHFNRYELISFSMQYYILD